MESQERTLERKKRDTTKEERRVYKKGDEVCVDLRWEDTNGNQHTVRNERVWRAQ